MPVVLLRVDERLIHGQVLIGWGHQLRPDRYFVVDDELAQSEWEQDLYRLAADLPVEFLTCAEAREAIQGWRAAPERSIVLLREIGALRKLGEGGVLTGDSVNLGGLHARSDRRPVLRYLHLSSADLEDLSGLAAEGVDIGARELPDSTRVGLKKLLAED